MKKFLFTLVALSTASAAHADGFVCHTRDSELRIKVYNHTRPEDGTRNASRMVLSNPLRSAGHKTIANFSDVEDTLTSVGANYEASVDRLNQNADREVGGMRLGSLKTLLLEVEFSYRSPVPHGKLLDGTLTLIQRNGRERRLSVLCLRYLKR